MKEWEIVIYKGKSHLLTLWSINDKLEAITKTQTKHYLKDLFKFQIINFKLQILMKTALRDTWAS